MPSLNRVRCVLAVTDLRKSTEFYKDKLGFILDFEIQGWSFLTRDNFSLMLGHCPGPDTVPAGEIGNHNYFAYVNVEDIDDLYAEYKNNNVEMLQEISTKPWNMREFLISTPDGHRIMFGMQVGEIPNVT